MRGRILKLLFGVFAAFLFLMTLTAHATAIFLITTSTPTVTLASGGSTTVTYQVKNQSNISFSAGQVKVKPPQFTTIASNTCSSAVPKGATCTVVLTVTAPSQPGTLTLILQVCALNFCSVPDSANRLTVIVSNVSSLAITPTSATISVGGTQQFTAIATFSNGSTADVTTQATWHSSNVSVAVIDPNGLATGISGGTTNITATFNGITSNTAVLTVSSNAYITNIGSNTVTLCGVDNSGNLTGCANSGATGITLPRSIAINSVNNQAYAYIPNNNASTPFVTYCVVNADGTLSSCADSGAGGDAHFDNTWAIAFNPAGTLAYVGDLNNADGSEIWICTVQSNGALWDGSSSPHCTASGATISGIVSGISFNAAGTRIYLSVFNQNLIRLCTVENDGTLTGCATTANINSAMSPVAFTNNGTRAYVTDNADNEVFLCNVAGDGSLSGCAALSIGAVFNGPTSVVFNQAETQAYVVNQNTSDVSLCVVDTSTGQFSSCGASGSSALTTPQAMILH